MRSLLLSLALWLTCAGLSAQRLIVVDPLNGPGTDYTDIVLALAAANHKDRVLFRNPPAQVPALTITKGIVLMPDTNRILTFRGVVTVRDIPAGESCTLVGINGDVAQLTNTIALANCQGTVHVDTSGAPRLDIRSCRLVTLTAVYWFVLAADRSQIVGSDCIGLAEWGSKEPPLQATASKISLSAGYIYGYNGSFHSPTCSIVEYPRVGSTLDNTELTFCGAFNRFGGGAVGSSFCGSIYADAMVCTNNCRITLAQGMFLRGNIVGSFTVTTESRPGLWASYPNITEVVQTTVDATPNASLGLFVSAPVLPYPSIFGELYLDPALCLWVTNAVCDAQGHWIQSFPVPSVIPRGLPVLFQAATVDATLGFQLTNPSVVALTRRSLY